MSSAVKEVSAEDQNRVKEIILKVKSKGLFDEFRKECLADVDTKPAYQNLRQRVEGYVTRYLSKQVWSPNLNKNQLRDQLRKQINQSGMLSSGVERVIDQVINPKIFQVFKPKIDEVVCHHLGIDPKEREEALRKKNLLQQQQAAMPLMGAGLSDVEFSSQSSSAYVGVTPSWNQQSVSGAFPSTSSIYPGPITHPPNYLGVPPPALPYMQQAWSSGYLPGADGFTQPALPPLPPMVPNPPLPASLNVPPPSTSTNPAPPGTAAFVGDISSGLPLPDLSLPPPSVTAPSLPPEPNPSDVPALPPDEPPMPPEIPEPPSDQSDDELSTEEMTEAVVEDDAVLEPAKAGVYDSDGILLDNIPLPPQSDEVKVGDELTGKQYHFAWDREMDEDEISQVTISSVHTSDISYYEEEEQEEDEDNLEDDLAETNDGVNEEVVDADGLTVTSSSQPDTTDESSPRKAKKESPPKPRKLLSLTYNLSDSDEDETREERKARIALEKEERYMRRQQRRAEMEAKRKEREEEKARQKEEQPQMMDEVSEDMEPEPADAKKESLSESKESKDDTQSSPEETAIPSKPTTLQKRKTKAQMKEQLREQKVLEKKQALRRQRTRNRKYTSDEFTSIFTEKKHPFSSQSYMDILTSSQEAIEIDTVISQTIEVEGEVTMDLYAKSPATPTQDEHFIVTVPDNEIVLSDSVSVPIYEVAMPTTSSLSIGQYVHYTRSHGRLSEESRSNDTHSTERPSTPYSDISDVSLTETKERRYNRRLTSDLGETNPHETRSRRSIVSPPPAETMPKKGRAETSGSDSVWPSDQRSGQRYSTDDLYKPRTSQRRAYSPPLPEPKSQAAHIYGYPIRNAKTPVEEKCHPSKRYDESDLYKPRLSFSSSGRRKSCPEPKRTASPIPSSYDDTRSRSPSPRRRGTGGRNQSQSSRSRSPLSSDSSDDNSRSHHDSRSSHSTDKKQSTSRLSSSDSLSSKSDDDEKLSTNSTDERQMRHRKPINEVDFGEAARRQMLHVNFGEAERRSRIQRQQQPRIDPNDGRLHNSPMNFMDMEPCMDPDRPVSPPGFGIGGRPYLSPVKYKDDWPGPSSGNSPGYSEGHMNRSFMPPSPPVTRRPPSPPLPWRPPSPGQCRERSQSPPLGLRSRRQVPPSLELGRMTRQRPVTPPIELGRKSRQRQLSPVLSDSGRITRQRTISPLDNIRVTRQQPASPLTPMERNTRQRGLNMQRRPTLPVGTRRRSPKTPSPSREVRRCHRSPTPPLPPKELRRQRPPSPSLVRETRSRQPQSPPPTKRTRR